MNTGLCVQEWDLDALLAREWLAANGIGGYASSTLAGLNTRKYHGLLVAAMAPPVRRMVLLSRVEESLWHAGQRFALDCNEYPGVIYPQGQRYLREFCPGHSPRWIYEADGWRLQKQLDLVEGSNTVVLTYTLLDGEGIDLQLRPLLALRPIHDLSYQFNGRLATEDRGPNHHRVAPTARTPEVFFAHDGTFTPGANWYLNQIYRREQQRGYSGLEDLWTPGAVRFRLSAGRRARFVCSTDPIDLKETVTPPEARQIASSADPVMRMLREAAGQFVVAGGTDRSAACIAGYPWFGPKSREGLIGFIGLFLVTGRFQDAQSMLLSLASNVRNGLMPSEFPENGGAPLYRGADISLWFANAAWDYLRYTGDEATARRLLEVILSVIGSYSTGTDLGLSIDPDGLLASRQPGIPTSWMDASAGDWAATPRTGLPVELNALWYNAVRIAAAMCEWLGRRDRAKSLNKMAASIERAFNDRFWNAAADCCFDVIDRGQSDSRVRPNQLLALSLPFPVLRADRHEAVLKAVREHLLVARGVRTLSPLDESYRGCYVGNVSARECAYHNGPAFPWLLGAYVQGMLRVAGRNDSSRAAACEVIRPCLEYAASDGMGQFPELFDGDAPHAPGGAIASAASAGEILRCYAEDVLGIAPTLPSTQVARPARSRRKTQERPSRVRHPRDASIRSASDR